MSCRRRDGAGQSGSFASVKDGAGQSGSFASVKAREAANCSGKPGAPQGHAPEKRENRRRLKRVSIMPFALNVKNRLDIFSKKLIMGA